MGTMTGLRAAMLVEHFLPKVRRGTVKGISLEAMEMLGRYPWPGHVRELRNVVERAVVMASGVAVGVDALPDTIIDYALAEKSEPYPDGQAKPHEQVMIETAPFKFRGDNAMAARFIGWSRTKLYRRRSRLGDLQGAGRRE